MNMYDVYVVEFDDGETYDNTHYLVGVFKTFKEAEEYCLSKGYDKTETEGVYKKEWENWKGHFYWLHVDGVNFGEIVNEVKE